MLCSWIREKHDRLAEEVPCQANNVLLSDRVLTNVSGAVRGER